MMKGGSYVQSKGSFHPLEVKEFSQTAWRQNMMKAVTAKDCVTPPNGACSVCGLVALPFPMLHFAGNFFTATCDYVKRLVPPAEFGGRMNEVVKSARLKHLEGQFVSNLLPPMAHYYGIDQFAMDYWITSHPYVVPCDVSPVPDVKTWYQQDLTQFAFEFAMYPRHDINAAWTYMTEKKLLRALQYPQQRQREYFLIPGYLYRWALLYNGERAPSDSWFWNWYPDGVLFRQKARQSGNLGALQYTMDLITKKG